MMQYPIRLAIAAAIALAVPSAAQADGRPLKLSDVLRRAQAHSSVAIAASDSQRAELAAKLERRRALLPSIGLSATGTLRDREFTLATPMGNLPIGDTTTVQAQLQVSQPILDATRLFYTAPAARLDAKAARLVATRTKDEAAAQAAEYYFAVLSYRAQLEANEAFVSSLETRLTEVRSLVEAERAVAADALRVQLALQDAKQRTLALHEQRKTAQLALGHALGLDDAVEAAPLDDSSQRFDNDAAPMRADLLALRSKRDAVAKRIAAVNTELIPKIELQGALVHTNAGPQAEENFAQGMIQLSWVPFAAGSRSARKDLYRAERSALNHQYQQAERGIALQRQQARASLAIADGQIALAATALEQATEAARVRRDRYQSGRETVSEVLEAEALVRDSASKAKLAKIERARAIVRLRLASGTPLAR